jgi:hypothetical protein
MLKVTVALYPYGDAHAKKTLYEIKIGNDLTGTGEKGNYKYTIYNCTTEKATSGALKNFKRSNGALMLVKEILGKEAK